MEHQKENEAFSYTYSAKEQEEVQRIRQKYVPKEEDKMEQLRKLDRSAVRKGTSLAIVLGIIGALILGIGMSCAMVWTDSLLIPGIIIGVVGIAIVAAAYPLYTHTTKRERERLAPEILRLTDELMK